MTEQELLLRAVCDDPLEDTPRLVYADWLQENGQEDRAAFIRRQIKLYREFDGETPTQKRKGGYYDVLMEGFKSKWRTFKSSASSTPKEVWQRGFLDEVTWSWSFYWDDSDRLRFIFQDNPIRLVNLPSRKPYTHHQYGTVFQVRGYGIDWSCDIPVEIVNWLPFGNRLPNVRLVQFKGYDKAQFALSIGAVRYARSVVGLKDLGADWKVYKA